MSREQVADIVEAWKELRYEVYQAGTVDELESLLIGAPLFDVWLNLMARDPLLIFDSMREIAAKVGNEVVEIAERELSSCY